VIVEARVGKRGVSPTASLREVRERPEILYPESNQEIRQFVLSLTRNMGIKRAAGQGSFINSVIDTTKDFYGEVVEGLRAWKAPPPKLKKQPEEEAALLEDLPAHLEEAVERAQDEASESQSVESHDD
jgi:hypothetical protein